MKIKTALIILLILTLILGLFGYFFSGRINLGEQLNSLKKKPGIVTEQTPASTTEEIMQKEAAEKAASEQRRVEIMDSLKAQMASDTPEEDPRIKEKKIDAMKKMLLK